MKQHLHHTHCYECTPDHMELRVQMEAINVTMMAQLAVPPEGESSFHHKSGISNGLLCCIIQAGPQGEQRARGGPVKRDLAKQTRRGEGGDKLSQTSQLSSALRGSLANDVQHPRILSLQFMLVKLARKKFIHYNPTTWSGTTATPLLVFCQFTVIFCNLP